MKAGAVKSQYQEIQKKFYEQKELQDCTFKPKITANTTGSTGGSK